MADVRALLAAERQSRRITHPHISYSKTGVLTCNVCDLNVKSEQLWPGHQKSLNHRQNVRKLVEVAPVRSAKRKIDRVEEEEENVRHYEVDSRKKPKSFRSHEEKANSLAPPAPPKDSVVEVTDHLLAPDKADVDVDVEIEINFAAPAVATGTKHPTSKVDTIDEDEWAAFERDVAPLAQSTYASAIIEAAPVSASDLAEQQKINAVQQREAEAEAEKEDEGRRLEEEFEVMEEMEDRVKALRARREALRTNGPTSEQVVSPVIAMDEKKPTLHDEVLEQVDQVSSDDETDEWYH